MEITYDYYRIFYYVARYGGISRAAEVLLQAQPNISKTIKNLEKQLGCRLFVRSNKGVTLTPEGEKLYKHLEIAFSHISSAESEILSSGSFDSGIISIATTEMAFYGLLLKAVSDFTEDYPNVKIKLTNLNNTEALAMLKNGIADFAVLTVNDGIDNSFRVEKIKEFREILCVKNGIIKDCEFNICDINKYNYIALNRSTSSYEMYRDYFLSIGINRLPDIEVATSTQVLSLVRAGVGIGFIAEPIAREWIDKGELKELKFENPPKYRYIYFVEDKGRSLSVVARKFLSYLR